MLQQCSGRPRLGGLFCAPRNAQPVVLSEMRGVRGSDPLVFASNGSGFLAVDHSAASASRTVGRTRPLSHLALIVFRPPAGSLQQYGIRPPRRGSSDISPVL